MARSSVGLDVGTRAVRAVEVRGGHGKATVTKFGRVLLPAGAMDHGEVKDPEAVASAIKKLWGRLGLKEKSVHLGLSNRRVVVRVMEMPAMKPDDLDSAIKFQAQDHIPIPLTEAVMDYQVLDEITDDQGQRFQRILVVAAERAAIDPLLTAISAAKLEPATLELNAYPLVRAFGTDSPEAEAIVDIGAGITNIVIHRGGAIQFTRILPSVGGDDFTSAVAEQLGIEVPEAESLKRRLGTDGFAAAPEATTDVPTPSESTPSEPSPFGADRPGLGVVQMEGMTFGSTAAAPYESSAPVQHLRPEYAAVEAMRPVLEHFTSEIRRSLDFYTGQANVPDLSRVTITGGGSLLADLPDAMSEGLGVPTVIGHTFAHVPMGDIKVSDEQLRVAERYMGVAVGLALAGIKG